MKKEILLLLLITALNIFGGEAGTADSSAVKPVGRKARVELANGSILHGELCREDEQVIELSITGGRVVSIGKAEISSLEYDDRLLDPNAGSFFLAPSALCGKKGQSYFSSYEVLLLNYGYSLTDDLQLGVMALFPVTGEMQAKGPKGAGFKYRFLDKERIDCALIGNYFNANKENGFYGGGIVTFKADRAGLTLINLSASASIGSDGFDWHAGAAFSRQISSNCKLIGEFATTLSRIDELGDLFDNSYGIAGFRFFGRRMSFDLAGLISPEEFDFGDDVDSQVYPFVSFSYFF